MCVGAQAIVHMLTKSACCRGRLLHLSKATAAAGFAGRPTVRINRCRRVGDSLVGVDGSDEPTLPLAPPPLFLLATAAARSGLQRRARDAPDYD